MEKTAGSIAIGGDHAAYALKEHIKKFLLEKGYDVVDAGTHGESSVDYPDFGSRVAGMVSSGKVPRGILICGTGIGMSMVANRFPGVRAALCSDMYSAAMGRRHNDANILALGARVIGEGLALEIVKVWLDTAFEGGRHQTRVDKIEQIECRKTGAPDPSASC